MECVFRVIAHLVSKYDELSFLRAARIIFGSEVKLVMDRGFYKERNINGLLKDHLKFLVAVKISLSYMSGQNWTKFMTNSWF